MQALETNKSFEGSNGGEYGICEDQPMLTELNGKAGCVCQPAKEGKLRCPLIIRQTSEDVVTGEIFETLGAINPRSWLPEFLNRALGKERFRRQLYRNFKIQLWQRQPLFPPGMIPWNEGQTEVDVVISWDNPPTTIFVEMKYNAPLSAGTTHNFGDGKYPANQLIRNARVGLHQCGWYVDDQLFDQPKRDFVLILMAPKQGNPLVTEYRNENRLRQAIPGGNRIEQLPEHPFIGELGYDSLNDILRNRRRFYTASERRLADQLAAYLDFKIQRVAVSSGRPHQYLLPAMTEK